MSKEIVDRQIELLEEKLLDIQDRKYEVIRDQQYEKAAELRDEERKVKEQLLEKDPGNEMVYSDQWYIDRFIKDGNKLEIIQELAGESKITVNYTININSSITYSEKEVNEILEKYNLSLKEWTLLTLEYNRINKESKTFTIDPSEGGTMSNYEISITPKSKSDE